jgi:DNA polymerase III epsilon subunit-like protein
MRQFSQWVRYIAGTDGTPVFVGFNAAFDWSFVNYYFHRYLGENPFGFAALDIKSLYMGAARTGWRQTRSSEIAAALHPTRVSDHDALHDAQYQAELFRLTRSKK